MKITIFLFTISIFSFTNAQSIFKDDLSTYIVNSPLNSQGPWTNNSATFGLGGCSGTGCTNANVIAQNMSYPNYGTTTKALKIDAGKDGIGRAISPVVTNGDLYVSMVLNLTSSLANANDFLRVASGVSSNVTFRMYAQPNANGAYNIGIKKGGSSNSTVYATDELIYGLDYLIVLKYSHFAGISDDIVKVYINPVYENGEPTLPSATTDIGSDQSGSIDRIAFRLNQNVAMPSGAASLLSIAKNWDSLGFIPLGINNNNFDNLFTIVGNQAKNGILNISSSKEFSNANVAIYTITGVLVENTKINIQNGNSSIIISPIQASGVYIVQLIDNSGKKYSQKIIIN